jgi:hypothetical protein
VTPRFALRSLLTPLGAAALALLLIASTGVATAATGGTFILGRGNSASSRTGLTSSSGTPLSLYAKAGYAPLLVNSATKVSNLNADKVDGLDSAQLQRRVSGTCAGGAVRSVTPLGAVTCVRVPARARFVPHVGIDGPDASQVLAAFDGVTVRGYCRRVGGSVPSALVAIYVNGAGVMHGHLTVTEGGATAVSAVSTQLAVTGNGSPLYARSRFYSDGGLVRATVIGMVDAQQTTTQITAHVVLDLRDTSAEARPCSVWATVV